MKVQEFLYKTTLITLIAILSKEYTLALRDVRVRVPHAVRRGDKAILKCFYNIEDDTLYSVKWYKGRREFYRYTPKETPPMKVFHFAGVKVRRIASNESQVVLDAVTMATSGKYSCEVSADAPSFHTLIAAAELEVIETPHNPPFITGIRPRYRVGDILRGNCTSRHSRPAANLTWTVNNEEVNPSHVRHHKIIRDVRNDMETAIVGIHFLVTDQHFENGKLKLRCSAQIHDIYWKTTEKTILEADQFTKYGSNVNMVNPDELYDQYTLQEGEMLHNKKNSYLTQLQGEEDDGDAEAAWRIPHNSATAPAVESQTQLPRLLISLLLLSWAYQQLGKLQQLTALPAACPKTQPETMNERKSKAKTMQYCCSNCRQVNQTIITHGWVQVCQRIDRRTVSGNYTSNCSSSSSSSNSSNSSNSDNSRQLMLQT